MARIRENYDGETVNLRAFYIRLISKAYLVVLSAIVMAVIFGGVYFLSNIVFAPARNYVDESTLYIYFAYDENKGTQVDYYNAYTWNVLIKTDEAIVGRIMESLKEAGYSEDTLPRDRVTSSMNADIPSDVRVMVLSITDKDEEICGAIMDAANEAMINYGKENSAFTQIELLGKSDPKPESVDDRLLTAVILGAVTGFVLMILFELIMESMNDAVYVPETAEKRYNKPVIGILTGSGKEEPAFFRNEMIECSEKILKNQGELAVLCVDDRDGKGCADAGCDRIKEVLGNSYGDLGIKLVPMPLPGHDTLASRELQNVSGAVILIKMGKRNSAMTDHLLSQLKKMDCNVFGIIIADADEKYLKRYLGL